MSQNLHLDRLRLDGEVQDLLRVLAIQRIDLADLRTRKDQALPPEVQAALAAHEAVFAAPLTEAQSQIADTEAQIKTLVREAGVTVKGPLLQAVFLPGRVSWDTPGLEGYGRAVPAILAFRRVGEPYVVIR